MKMLSLESVSYAILAVVLSICTPAALSQEEGQGERSAVASGAIKADTRWGDVSAVRLDVEFPGDGYHASWLLHRCNCGDLLVESELSLPGEVEKGELLLVGQRAVLERGFKSKELESQMSWDAPALMLQLTAYLLERSLPAGPASVVQPTVVSFRESREAIELDSGNAVGGFPAPWEVTVTAEPEGASHRRFDLRFNFSVPGEGVTAAMRLKGIGDYSNRPFPHDETMPLQGWVLSWRNPSDPAANEGEVDSLGALRDLINNTTLLPTPE